VKAKVVSKDVGAKETSAKAQVVLKYSFACPITKLRKKNL
jgi:hypothetical protein